MRIAAKRLRYILELSSPFFGAYAATAAKQARDLQDVIGEIHDCDVLLPWLQARLKEVQIADAAVVRRAGRQRTGPLARALGPRAAAPRLRGDGALRRAPARAT